MFKCSSLFVVLQDGKVDQKWKWPLGRLQTTVTVQVCLSFHYIWQQKNSQRNVTQRLEDACIHRRSMQAHASSLVSRVSDVIFSKCLKNTLLISVFYFQTETFSPNEKCLNRTALKLKYANFIISR